jgi:hypothetical protein
MNFERFNHTVTTTCGSGGVGCRLETPASQGPIATVAPALDQISCLTPAHAGRTGSPRRRTGHS